MGSTFTEKHGLLDVTSEDEGYQSEVTSPIKHFMEKERLGMNPPADLESQAQAKGPDSGKQGAEYSVPAATKYSYLALYFALNLGLTLFNKAVLGKFAFPWLLTAIHTSTAALGCQLLRWQGQFEVTTLTTRENVTLLAFSVLYTVNIAISNVSLYVQITPLN